MKTKLENRMRLTDRTNDHHIHRTVMDVKLFKFLGLYQLLYPSDSYRWYRSIVFGTQWLGFGLQTVRMYIAFVYVDLALFLTTAAVVNLLSIYKVYVIMTNNEITREVLKVTRFSFTTCGIKEPDFFTRSRRTLRTLQRIFAAILLSLILSWIISPNMVKKMFPHADVSNDTWTMLFVTDGISITLALLCWLWFDCYLVTVCVALSCQFKNVTVGYEMLGQRSCSTSLTSSISDLNSEETNLIYEELINLIRDSQKLVQKYDDFFSIVRSVVIIQIIAGSITLLGFIFVSISMYYNGWPIISTPVLFFFAAFTVITFQLFIYCLSINNVVESKSGMNFGLYSSNWTEMDLKFKKTLLLAMRMNFSHQNKIKFTPKNSVNLEMFSSVMNLNYTILTVLLKMKINQIHEVIKDEVR